MQTDTDTTEIEINRIKYVRKDTIKSAPEISNNQLYYDTIIELL